MADICCLVSSFSGARVSVVMEALFRILIKLNETKRFVRNSFNYSIDKSVFILNTAHGSTVATMLDVVREMHVNFHSNAILTVFHGSV